MNGNHVMSKSNYSSYRNSAKREAFAPVTLGHISEATVAGTF
jgi:hypothetical protein